jgi:hypothetical protein
LSRGLNLSKTPKIRGSTRPRFYLGWKDPPTPRAYRPSWAPLIEQRPHGRLADPQRARDVARGESLRTQAPHLAGHPAQVGGLVLGPGSVAGVFAVDVHGVGSTTGTGRPMKLMKLMKLVSM